MAVGLIEERTTNMIVGILGILKAGGAYLPIDPDCPAERKKYLLADSGAGILLGNGEINHELQFNGKIVTFQDQEINANDTGNLGKTSTGNNLAYIIYTSGSTGNPKGVMIEQHSIINFIDTLEERIHSMHHWPLRIALVAPFVFDMSGKSIYAALLRGHNLHIVPDSVRIDGRQLVAYFKNNAIDIADGTPAHLDILANVSALKDIGVKHFIIGGDAISTTSVQNFYNNSGKNKPLITNTYGPTECCVSMPHHF